MTSPIEGPQLIILAGPNGAGKTTCAARLLPDNVPFINADEIAKGLKGYEGVPQDLRAGRILLQKVSEFESKLQSFAIETNLANRALLQRIKRLQTAGYSVTVIFLWLRSVDLAIDRVMERVRRGGHSIPSEVIRRRYHIGVSHFLKHYKYLVDSWAFFDNSDGDTTLVACHEQPGNEVVLLPELWDLISKGGQT